MADYNRASGDSAEGKPDEHSRVSKTAEWEIGSTPDRPGQPAGKEVKPLVDEAVWLRKQREIPPALRQPLLDVVLSRLDDKKAKAECHRLFGLSKGDETRFAQSLENKVRGYEKRHGVRLSLDQVLAEEHAYQKSRNPDSGVFPDGYLDRLEFAANYSEKSKKIISDFENDHPHVDFSKWTQEIKYIDNSFRKLHRGADPNGVESAIRGIESLRAEMYVAEKFPDTLLAIRLPVEHGDIKSDFDIVVGTIRPTATMRKFDHNSTVPVGNIQQIIEVKHTEPYGVRSSTWEDLLDQLGRLEKLKKQYCPDAQLSCWFTKGVESKVAERLMQRNIEVTGKRVNHLIRVGVQR